MDGLLEAVLETRVRAAPHAVEELAAQHDIGRPRGQDLQHQQRPALELERSVAQPRNAAGRVDRQASAYDRTEVSGAFAQDPTNPCEHHLSVRAFDDVVRGAALDADDLIRGRMARAGQDDHRKRNPVTA